MTNEQFKQWRESLKLNCAECGRLLGVSVSTIYRWEEGSRKVGNVELKLIDMINTTRQIYPAWFNKLMRECSK